MELRLPSLYPGYKLIGWRVVAESASHRVYRPGPGKLARRLLLALLLLGLAAGLLYERSKLLGKEAPFSSDTNAAWHFPLETGLSEAELEGFRQRGEQQRREAISEFRARQQMLGAVCAVASAVLAVVGLLAFLPLLFSRVSMQLERGTLIVRDGVLRRRTRVLSPHDYACIQYGAEERAIRHRSRRIVGSYWVWFVLLCPAMQHGALSGPPVEFYPLQWAERPGAQPRPPEEVRGLIQFLHNCTRLPVEGPQWAELRILPNGHVGTAKVHTVATAPMEVFRTERRIPLDQTPEALRSLAGGGMNMRRINDGTGTIYILEDSMGREYRYNSPDEMPPAHRTFYELILKFDKQHR